MKDVNGVFAQRYGFAVSLAADQVPQFTLNAETTQDKEALEVEQQVVTSKDFAKLEMDRKAEQALEKQSSSSVKRPADAKPGQPSTAAPQSKRLFHKDVFIVRYHPMEHESQELAVRS